MPKTIDPIERALDAYFQLDTDQRVTFAMAIKHVERFAAQLGANNGAGIVRPPAAKRGRPTGSKNRKLVLTEPASPLSPEGFEATALFAQNGAPTENV